MIIQAFAFYLFSGVLVLSALMVVCARNPVHSVLFLILAFFSAAGIFLLLGAEFLAMIMVIVYVGAVAVLFLFVVMMLDLDFVSLRKDIMSYVPFGLLMGGILLFELITIYTYWRIAPVAMPDKKHMVETIPNTQAIGLELYTEYVLAFQMSGLVLLVSMIGAIVLTLRKRSDIRRQKMNHQHRREASDVLEIKKITPKTGI
ncbi:MAG: NADH-quinone oxidoreductase subunit J [Alphaproteobacteria bacterium]